MARIDPFILERPKVRIETKEFSDENLPEGQKLSLTLKGLTRL